MTANNEFEYGIRLKLNNELWRGPYTYDKASQWLRDAEADGMDTSMFELVYRRINPWKVYDG